MTKYLSGWESVDEMLCDFNVDVDGWAASLLPTDEEVVFGVYELGDYEGEAFVLYVKDGRLFEVHGGHCSCYGLEGQWDPEETTLEALRLRPFTNLTGYFGISKEEILAVIEQRLRLSRKPRKK